MICITTEALIIFQEVTYVFVIDGLGHERDSEDDDTGDDE